MSFALFVPSFVAGGESRDLATTGTSDCNQMRVGLIALASHIFVRTIFGTRTFGLGLFGEQRSAPDFDSQTGHHLCTPVGETRGGDQPGPSKGRVYIPRVGTKRPVTGLRTGPAHAQVELGDRPPLQSRDKVGLSLSQGGICTNFKSRTFVWGQLQAPLKTVAIGKSRFAERGLPASALFAFWARP